MAVFLKPGGDVPWWYECMKLEDFLYEWCTNFLEFRPGPELQDAIMNFVYKGTTDGPPPWTGSRMFYEECTRGTEYFLEHNLDKLNKAN